VSDGEGDEFDPSLVSPEGREEGGILRGLSFELGVAAEVPAKSNFDNDEDAVALVEGCRVRVGGVGYPSGVNEVRRCSMSGGVQLLDFLL
jgi:hypothetical protein